MGYRSEFKLAFSGSKENLEKVIEYIQELYTRPHNEVEGSEDNIDAGWYSQRSWAELFCEAYTWANTHGANGEIRHAVIWEESHCKCYGDFDVFIDRVMAYAEEVDCDSGFARVGEEDNDTERKSRGPNDSVYIPVIQRVGDVEW